MLAIHVGGYYNNKAADGSHFYCAIANALWGYPYTTTPVILTQLASYDEYGSGSIGFSISTGVNGTVTVSWTVTPVSGSFNISVRATQLSVPAVW
jgi:hypothetical protein